MLNKTFHPNEVEARLYAKWEKSGAFKAGKKANVPSFSIVIPPPNITGNLHVGHALNNTLQDVLVRWRRMDGFDVLWLPGIDHAGIATQMVVERDLRRRGLSRHTMGRDAFLVEVWAWKDRHESAIVRTLQKLG